MGALDNHNEVMHQMQAASLTLERVIARRGSLSTIMPEYEGRLPAQRVPKYKELCFGSCRWFYRIQSIINQLVERPLKDNEIRVRAILTVAIYQLLETNTPDHAVVNEAVDIARKLNKPWAKGLINALLRECIRSRRSLSKEDGQYRHAHNPWFLEKIQTLYPDNWAQIIKANNHRPPLCLRVNLRRIKRENYLAMLGDQNVSAHASPFLPSAVYLTTPMPVNSIPGFRDGLVSVQDEGAQLAGYLLNLEKNDRCLDACSAPGGKAGHLLEMEPSIHLVALEWKERKLGAIASNMARLKVYAHLQQGDATNLDWWDGRQYDAILIDAPCSGSGVVRRHPDIKILLEQQQVDENRAIQRQMLQQLWQTLRAEGKMLYCTCSIFPEENEEIIEEFTTTCGNAEVEPISLPEGIPQHKTANGVQLLPSMSANDGFYFSLLKKTD